MNASIEGETFGRYQVVKHLASGGMAEVWLANVFGPAGFRKKVVIKTLRQQLANDPSAVSMFIHEARLAAQLNHPNIVQVFDFGELFDSYFLAMEYVSGATLRLVHRKLIKEQCRLMPVPLVLTTLVDVCDALTHAHNLTDDSGNWLRLVHRDVTPENVMLTHTGITKVLDFGIAKADTTEPTEAGIVKGKCAYMAPEQIVGAAMDGRGDLYAVGIVAYELLTGARPFRNKSAFELMRQTLKEAPQPLRARAPWIPEALEQIVLRCLAKNPDDRYQSASDLGEAFEGVLHAYHEVLSNRTIAGFVHQLFGAAPNQAPDAIVQRDTSTLPNDGRLPPTERIASQPDGVEREAVSISEDLVVELPDEDCISIVGEPSDVQALKGRLSTSARRTRRRDLLDLDKVEGWGEQPESAIEDFDWEAPIATSGRHMISLPGPVSDAPSDRASEEQESSDTGEESMPSLPRSASLEFSSEALSLPTSLPEQPPPANESRSSSPALPESVEAHGWDAAVLRAQGAPRPNVARLFDTSPRDDEVADALPEREPEQEREANSSVRRSAWDIVLETREKAAGPRDRADSYGDIWTPSRKRTASTVFTDPGDAEAEAARAFDRGLASYRKEEYGDALEAWERACRLAPANRTYTLNLNKLQALVERRRRR